MTPFAKALSMGMVLDAARAQGDKSLFTMGQLVNAGIGAGLGGLGGIMMARMLGDMFGVPRQQTSSILGRGGLLAGGLVGSGLVR